jgi:hypothetical protein
MKQIARLDHAECVHHGDAISEYNLGFHAVGNPTQRTLYDDVVATALKKRGDEVESDLRANDQK